MRYEWLFISLLLLPEKIWDLIPKLRACGIPYRKLTELGDGEYFHHTSQQLKKENHKELQQ